MAWRLAQTGKRILLLERGDYLPRERENWDSQAVFVEARYQARETWYSSDGRQLPPGPALLRRRQQQGLWRRAVAAARAGFRRGPASGRHLAGLAARLRRVRALLPGRRGALPRARRCAARIRPSRRRRKPYAFPPITPRAAHPGSCSTAEARGPSSLPPAGRRAARRAGRPGAAALAPASAATPSTAIPASINGKADAQIICVDPALRAHPNLTLLTDAYVERLTTDPSGTRRHRRRGRRAMAQR